MKIYEIQMKKKYMFMYIVIFDATETTMEILRGHQ